MATNSWGDLKTGGIIMDDVAILAADVYSYIVDIQRANGIGVDIFLSNNDAAGAIRLQVCNDLTPSSPNWVDIAYSDGSTSISVGSGTDINKFSNLWPITAKYFRVFYDATSGTTGNTLRVSVHCKQILGA